MFFTTAFLAVFSACLASVASASPIPVERSALQGRAGPSGTVIFPPGNTVFLNLGQTGDLHIQYQRVNTTLPNDEGPAWTVGIDLFLEDPTGAQADMPITCGFRANPVTASVIDGHFVPPEDACGSYNLVAMEHQYYRGEVITFRAAAPYVSVTCGPIQ
ncbi:hypothetical protein CALVIDRAFT_561537 [Calocera viscosa TUFC12733]|uniref:Ubiquitin 3 binding protein But2 C-terminal domain-containing protein n=1 Tax=Calocera viscosa (strain TUFC12733) TaxID=1330018 RepID=A0A167PUH2_CALVF|nr:hypothetical protein CALVIDRAFT_561537 [Calocera viscosa TUFC12733]